ncbi:hypothetical protein [Helicobacter cetorum]|uniref:hypothetical protein n=1 Tax=Helicobacter cetorum TaxID=138563 RepID=UPI000CF12C7F|nr:hypothetical protein [Helicobacter cetorum]
MGISVGAGGGGSSGSYTPSFQPLGPWNDHVSGTGAGGYTPGFRTAFDKAYDNFYNKNEEIIKEYQKFYTDIENIDTSLKGLQNSLNQNLNTLNNLNHSINSDLNSQNQLKQSISESNKRLKELIKKQAIANKRFDKKFTFDFNFNNREKQQANNKIFEGLFNQGFLRVVDVFLTNPYAIFPKGAIYEYHNPGSLNYNALNAYNPMDGINNQFRISVLNELNNNTFHRNLAGNSQYNYFVGLNFAKAISPEFVVFHFLNPLKQKQAWVFLMQNEQYSKGERLKVYALSFKSVFKALENIKDEIKNKEKELKTKEQELQEVGKNNQELESLKAKEQAEIKKLESEIQTKKQELGQLKDKMIDIRDGIRNKFNKNFKGFEVDKVDKLFNIVFPLNP